jgi:hypothetical protein
MRVLKQSEVKSVSGGLFFKLFLLKKIFHKGHGYGHGGHGHGHGYGHGHGDHKKGC